MWACHPRRSKPAALYARQPPGVRAALDAIGQFASSPRFAPFEDSEAERFRQVGIHPDTGTTILAASDGLDEINGLQERMGTDRDKPRPAPTTRDHLAAAVKSLEPMR